MKGDNLVSTETSLSLEQILRARYTQIAANIHADNENMEALERRGMRHGFEKREHERLKARQQVEYYKRDELRLIATRAGLKL